MTGRSLSLPMIMPTFLLMFCLPENKIRHTQAAKGTFIPWFAAIWCAQTDGGASRPRKSLLHCVCSTALRPPSQDPSVTGILCHILLYLIKISLSSSLLRFFRSFCRFGAVGGAGAEKAGKITRKGRKKQKSGPTGSLFPYSPTRVTAVGACPVAGKNFSKTSRVESAMLAVFTQG